MALWEAFSAISGPKSPPCRPTQTLCRPKPTLRHSSQTPRHPSQHLRHLVTASRTPVPASGTPGRESLPPDISGIDRDTEIREYKAMFDLNDAEIGNFSHELVVNC